MQYGMERTLSMASGILLFATPLHTVVPPGHSRCPRHAVPPLIPACVKCVRPVNCRGSKLKQTSLAYTWPLADFQNPPSDCDVLMTTTAHFASAFYERMLHTKRAKHCTAARCAGCRRRHGSDPAVR